MYFCQIRIIFGEKGIGTYVRCRDTRTYTDEREKACDIARTEMYDMMIMEMIRQGKIERVWEEISVDVCTIEEKDQEAYLIIHNGYRGKRDSLCGQW